MYISLGTYGSCSILLPLIQIPARFEFKSAPYPIFFYLNVDSTTLRYEHSFLNRSSLKANIQIMSYHLRLISD
jgi:hypothetical protein